MTAIVRQISSFALRPFYMLTSSLTKNRSSPTYKFDQCYRNSQRKMFQLMLNVIKHHLTEKAEKLCCQSSLFGDARDVTLNLSIRLRLFLRSKKINLYFTILKLNNKNFDVNKMRIAVIKTWKRSFYKSYAVESYSAKSKSYSAGMPLKTPAFFILAYSLSKSQFLWKFWQLSFL